jgi:hypothetical protein
MSSSCSSSLVRFSLHEVVGFLPLEEGRDATALAWGRVVAVAVAHESCAAFWTIRIAIEARLGTWVALGFPMVG